jgi:asparagine synthase (glutamine-hydrolysing)
MDSSICKWFQVTSDDGAVAAVVRGAAFYNQHHLKDEEFARCVLDYAAGATPDQRLAKFRDLACGLNGSWAFVIQWSDGEALAVTDRLRSIPLFYGRPSGEGIVFTNSVAELDGCENARTLDSEAAVEFLLSGYVMGCRTLRKGVSQMEPGEIVHCKNGKLARDRYYRFLRQGWSEAGQQQLTRELDSVMHRVFARWVEAHKSETVIVPLSGGLDSRLVLTMLKLHGHQNLIALNYGRSVDGKESAISRAVAKALGVPWRFYPYEEGEWYPLMRSSRMRQFWLYSGQDAVLPHVQDYLALRKLREQEPRLEAFFLPGLVGDMIAGAWVPDHFTDNEGPLEIDKVCEWMFYRKYWEWYSFPRNRLQVQRRMREFFAEAKLGKVHNSAAAFDLFEFENRQARYIANVVRTMEFHGFQWGLPLCDNELMDFYLTVPTELREMKRLYALWMRDLVFVGALRPLADIAPVGDGRCVWYNEPRPVLHRRFHGLREKLRSLGGPMIPSPIKHLRWRRELRHYVPHPLRFNEWFASDDAQCQRLTTGAFMRGPDGLLSSLPSSVQELVLYCKDRPLCLGSVLGVFSAVYLSELNQRLFKS